MGGGVAGRLEGGRLIGRVMVDDPSWFVPASEASIDAGIFNYSLPGVRD